MGVPYYGCLSSKSGGYFYILTHLVVFDTIAATQDSVGLVDQQTIWGMYES